MTVGLARGTVAALLAAALLSVAGCLGGGAGDEPAAAPAPAGPVSKLPTSRKSHVVVVVMENKERGEVVGSRDAPYVTKLANRYAAPRQMYGVAHPSLPNYLALVGGSTFGVSSNCTGCMQRGRTLVDQLESAHLSWRAYMEAMPRACFTGAHAGRYAKKHDPFVYFRRVVDVPKRCHRVVPAARLAADMRAGRLPRFAFITPDLCNDTHDCSVAHGDRYLSKLIPPLLHQLGPHGFLVLTYDEGSSDAHGGGRIPAVIAGPDVRRGAKPPKPYTHYSTLRTIEDAFRLGHLRKARGARSLGAAFRRAPRLR